MFERLNESARVFARGVSERRWVLVGLSGAGLAYGMGVEETITPLVIGALYVALFTKG